MFSQHMLPQIGITYNFTVNSVPSKIPLSGGVDMQTWNLGICTEKFDYSGKVASVWWNLWHQ